MVLAVIGFAVCAMGVTISWVRYEAASAKQKDLMGLIAASRPIRRDYEELAGLPGGRNIIGELKSTHDQFTTLRTIFSDAVAQEQSRAFSDGIAWGVTGIIFAILSTLLEKERRKVQRPR